MFYNKKINRYAENAPVTDMETVARWLSDDAAGTLVMTSDLACAVRVFKASEGCVPDLYFGKLPEDPRAFNALCICPPPGRITGYRRIVLAGMPDEFPAEGNAQVFRMETSPAWFAYLPDLEKMREVWKALGRVFARPVSYYTLRQLTHLICADTGMDPRTVTASLMAINDMDLVELDLDVRPIAIRKSEKKKADPGSSAIWRTIQRWRQV